MPLSARDEDGARFCHTAEPFHSDEEAVIALRWPVVAMALICLCLIGYLRPDSPGPKDVGH